ncbi:hypothetical protein [Oscillibacter sp.]|uniref:hypothetical protein n=1 Tax=Oscillibacter sp. TaxID=1945593 RepID=UPI00338EA314
MDYFDFYLFHNVCGMNIDAYLDPQYGIHDYLMEQKRRGRIRHLGFSCHGNLPVLKRFLDAYGKDYGVLSAAAELHRLDLPERPRKGGAAG